MDNLYVLSEKEEADFIREFNALIKREREFLNYEESSSHFIEIVFFSEVPSCEKHFKKIRDKLRDSDSYDMYSFDKADEIGQKPYDELMKSAGWHLIYSIGLPEKLVWNVKDMDSSQHNKLITAKDMAKYDTRDTKGLCNFLKEYYKKVEPKLSQEQKKHKHFSVLFSDIPEKYISNTYKCNTFNDFYLHYLSTKGITVYTNEVTILGKATKYLDVYYDKLDKDV